MTSAVVFLTDVGERMFLWRFWEYSFLTLVTQCCNHSGSFLKLTFFLFTVQVRAPIPAIVAYIETYVFHSSLIFLPLQIEYLQEDDFSEEDEDLEPEHHPRLSQAEYLDTGDTPTNGQSPSEEREHGKKEKKKDMEVLKV